MSYYENRRRPIFFNKPVSRVGDSKVHFVHGTIYARDTKFPQWNGTNESFLCYIILPLKSNPLSLYHIPFNLTFAVRVSARVRN